MARKKAMTRSDLISLLKSRGTKGRLSKMTKPQLKALVDKSAPPDDGPAHDEKRPRGDLELGADEGPIVQRRLAARNPRKQLVEPRLEDAVVERGNLRERGAPRLCSDQLLAACFSVAAASSTAIV